MSIRLFSILLICLILISSQCRTVKQTLDCIKKYTGMKNNMQNICVNDTQCTKTVWGMKQCLVNNQCYKQIDSDQMDVHCWNCWADYMTDSHIISDFQDTLHLQCSESNLRTIFIYFVLLVLSFTLL